MKHALTLCTLLTTGILSAASADANARLLQIESRYMPQVHSPHVTPNAAQLAYVNADLKMRCAACKGRLSGPLLHEVRYRGYSAYLVFWQGCAVD